LLEHQTLCGGTKPWGLDHASRWLLPEPRPRSENGVGWSRTHISFAQNCWTSETEYSHVRSCYVVDTMIKHDRTTEYILISNNVSQRIYNQLEPSRSLDLITLLLTLLALHRSLPVGTQCHDFRCETGLIWQSSAESFWGALNMWNPLVNIYIYIILYIYIIYIYCNTTMVNLPLETQISYWYRPFLTISAFSIVNSWQQIYAFDFHRLILLDAQSNLQFLRVVWPQNPLIWDDFPEKTSHHGSHLGR